MKAGTSVRIGVRSLRYVPPPLKLEAQAPGALRRAKLQQSRPRRRAAEQRDELAPFHSITSSARTRIVSGIVIPKALAVLRFTASSNLAGRSIGRLLGSVPAKILPT